MPATCAAGPEDAAAASSLLARPPFCRHSRQNRHPESGRSLPAETGRSATIGYHPSVGESAIGDQRSLIGQHRPVAPASTTKDAARKSRRVPKIYGKVMFVTKDQNQLRIVNDDGSLGTTFDWEDLTPAWEWVAKS